MARFKHRGEPHGNAHQSEHFLADFAREDVAFVQWLSAHGGPPCNAPMLPDDRQQTFASDDFEERTVNAVFARLALQRSRPLPAPGRCLCPNITSEC